MKWRRRKRGTLAGTVALSNKACPHYYHSEDPAASKRCECPPERCWYDEQLRRRSRSLLALTPEEWKRRLETEKHDAAYSTLYNFIRGT